MTRGYDEREHWEVYEKMHSYRFKLDSLSYATSVEQEIRLTVRELYKWKKKVQEKRRITMNEMREMIRNEGHELHRQNLISGFYGNELSCRIEEYWKLKNQMAHEPDCIRQMDHNAFQTNAQWITEQLRLLQDCVQRLHYPYRQ